MFSKKKKYLKDKEKYNKLRKDLIEEKNNLSNAVGMLQNDIDKLQIKKFSLLITISVVTMIFSPKLTKICLINVYTK